MNKTIDYKEGFTSIINRFQLHQQISQFMDKKKPNTYNLTPNP